MAQLKFNQNPIELRPGAADETVTTEFHFINESKEPLTLAELETSCSCLDATTDKTVYQPGERGSGKATFKISSFVGRHQKTIYFPSQNASQEKSELDIIIDIPAAIDLQPKMQEWVIGSSPAPKVIDVQIKTPEPIHITSLESTRDFITYELLTLEKGRHYQIRITPKSTEKTGIGALKIQTDSPIRKYNRQMAFFNIITQELAAKKAAARAQESAKFNKN